MSDGETKKFGCRWAFIALAAILIVLAFSAHYQGKIEADAAMTVVVAAIAAMLLAAALTGVEWIDLPSWLQKATKILLALLILAGLIAFFVALNPVLLRLGINLTVIPR